MTDQQQVDLVEKALGGDMAQMIMYGYRNDQFVIEQALCPVGRMEDGRMKVNADVKEPITLIGCMVCVLTGSNKDRAIIVRPNGWMMASSGSTISARFYDVDLK